MKKVIIRICYWIAVFFICFLVATYGKYFLRGDQIGAGFLALAELAVGIIFSSEIIQIIESLVK